MIQEERVGMKVSIPLSHVCMLIDTRTLQCLKGGCTAVIEGKIAKLT